VIIFIVQSIYLDKENRKARNSGGFGTFLFCVDFKWCGTRVETFCGEKNVRIVGEASVGKYLF